MFALRLAVLKHIVSWDLESDTYECTLYSTHHIQISLLYNTVNIVVTAQVYHTVRYVLINDKVNSPYMVLHTLSKK